MKPAIYIFLNKGLHMSAGKLAAQAAHAAIMGVIDASGINSHTAWIEAPHRYVIVLQARDEDHLHNIATYLNQRGIGTREIIDEGTNEIDPHTCVALATSIVDKDDSKIEQALSTFELYRDDIRVTLEIPR